MPDQKISADPILSTPSATAALAGIDPGTDATKNYRFTKESMQTWLGSGQVTATVVPTTGAHTVGEFVRNSAPTEQGSAGAKFIVQGWTCITSGTPGTWVANNVFTGN